MIDCGKNIEGLTWCRITAENLPTYMKLTEGGRCGRPKVLVTEDLSKPGEYPTIFIYNYLTNQGKGVEKKDLGGGCANIFLKTKNTDDSNCETVDGIKGIHLDRLVSLAQNGKCNLTLDNFVFASDESESESK